MEGVLHYISRQINISHNEKRLYNQHFQNFIYEFIEDMMDIDELFAYMYRKIAFVGSYWEGAKIDKPDEFDLNIVLKLPVKCEEIEIKNAGQSGFLTVKIDRNSIKKLPKQKMFKVMQDWFDDKNFFLPDKFRNWMYSVVQKTFNEIGYDLCLDYNVQVKTNGPAITLFVGGKYPFSIDIVPVIQMPNSRWPEPPFRPNPYPKLNHLAWSLIPKPRKGINVQTEPGWIYWRPSFYDYERRLMMGQNRLKPAWKILKKLKESRGMERIVNYHIKNLCLIELEKNKDIWNTKSLEHVFLHLLKVFQLSLQVKKLPFYWQMDDNLYKTIKNDILQDHYQHITKIIKKIEQNPKSISEYFRFYY
ncbi:cyclic GMP-AMP synthase-like [Chrysoperla carnea]|uniref:cyclic GMP-AMP synthase-like n=1 Tax=Chrysoperla carnea TaxID=189513 RepID=UPI001D098DF7|nr:cyclic GMP-AMP synthase-like [Chrysoperla carnea]